MTKKNSEDVLVEVVRALCDKNNKIYVETINGIRNLVSFSTSWSPGRDNTGIPFPESLGKRANVRLATSIKIGKNIFMKRLQDGTYVVRTENGEAKFNINRDNEFKRVWQSALMNYEDEKAPWKWRFGPILQNLPANSPVYKATYTAGRALDTKSRFEQAQENLKKLGVEHETRITQYMQKKFMQNTQE